VKVQKVENRKNLFLLLKRKERKKERKRNRRRKRNRKER